MAEKADPDFYLWNHVYLGKTYLQLGEVEKGKWYLNRAREMTRKNISLDEHEAQMEAFRTLLNHKLIDPKDNDPKKKKAEESS